MEKTSSTIKYFYGDTELGVETTEYIVTTHYIQYCLFKYYESGKTEHPLTATVSTTGDEIKYLFGIEKGVKIVSNFNSMKDSELYHETDFLIFENGRIGRGHAKKVEKALEEAVSEIRWRGFENMTSFKKHVLEVAK